VTSFGVAERERVFFATDNTVAGDIYRACDIFALVDDPIVAGYVDYLEIPAEDLADYTFPTEYVDSLDNTVGLVGWISETSMIVSVQYESEVSIVDGDGTVVFMEIFRTLTNQLRYDFVDGAWQPQPECEGDLPEVLEPIAAVAPITISTEDRLQYEGRDLMNRLQPAEPVSVFPVWGVSGAF